MYGHYISYMVSFRMSVRPENKVNAMDGAWRVTLNSPDLLKLVLKCVKIMSHHHV